MRLGTAPDPLTEIRVVGHRLPRASRPREPQASDGRGFDGGRRLRARQGDGAVRPGDQLLPAPPHECVEHVPLADLGRDVRVALGVHQGPGPAQPGLGLHGPATHDRQVSQDRVAQRCLAQALHLGNEGRRGEDVARSDGGVDGPRQAALALQPVVGEPARVVEQRRRCPPRPDGRVLGGQRVELVGDRGIGHRRRGDEQPEPPGRIVHQVRGAPVCRGGRRGPHRGQDRGPHHRIARSHLGEPSRRELDEPGGVRLVEHGQQLAFEPGEASDVPRRGARPQHGSRLGERSGGG